jgi:hypothetical protein
LKLEDDPITTWTPKLERAVRYLGIEVKYAPEMVEQTALCYVLLEKAVFYGRNSAKKTSAELCPCTIGGV